MNFKAPKTHKKKKQHKFRLKNQILS